MKFICNLRFVFLPPPSFAFAARQGLCNWGCFFSLSHSSNDEWKEICWDIEWHKSFIIFFSLLRLNLPQKRFTFVSCWNTPTTHQINSILFIRNFLSFPPNLANKRGKEICLSWSLSLVWDVKRIDSDCVEGDRKEIGNKNLLLFEKICSKVNLCKKVS